MELILTTTTTIIIIIIIIMIIIQNSTCKRELCEQLHLTKDTARQLREICPKQGQHRKMNHHTLHNHSQKIKTMALKWVTTKGLTPKHCGSHTPRPDCTDSCLLKKQIIHCKKTESLSHLNSKFHPDHGHTDMLATDMSYSFSGTTA
jgi:hypothetical protein